MSTLGYIYFILILLLLIFITPIKIIDWTKSIKKRRRKVFYWSAYFTLIILSFVIFVYVVYRDKFAPSFPKFAEKKFGVFIGNFEGATADTREVGREVKQA